MIERIYPGGAALTAQVNLQALPLQVLFVHSLDHGPCLLFGVSDTNPWTAERKSDCAEAAAVSEAEAERAGRVSVEGVINLRHNAPEILL